MISKFWNFTYKCTTVILGIIWTQLGFTANLFGLPQGPCMFMGLVESGGRVPAGLLHTASMLASSLSAAWSEAGLPSIWFIGAEVGLLAAT